MVLQRGRERLRQELAMAVDAGLTSGDQVGLRLPRPAPERPDVVSFNVTMDACSRVGSLGIKALEAFSILFLAGTSMGAVPRLVQRAVWRV